MPSPKIQPTNPFEAPAVASGIEDSPKKTTSTATTTSAPAVGLEQAFFNRRSYRFSSEMVTTPAGAQLNLLEVAAKQNKEPTATLFVPGFWSNAQMFLRGMQFLASNKGLTSFAFSQEGHGRSSGHDLPKLNYSLGRYVDNLASIIKEVEQRGITKLHLVGHSFGTRLILEYLAENPASCITTATLITPVPPAGMLAANLRFAMLNPVGYLRAHLTLNALEAMSDPRIAALALFSTTTDQLPPTFKPEKESLLANYQACLPISGNSIRKINQSGISIAVFGAEDDNVFKAEEIHSTAAAFGTTAKFFPGSHMGIIMPQHRDAYLESLASRIGL